MLVGLDKPRPVNSEGSRGLKFLSCVGFLMSKGQMKKRPIARRSKKEKAGKIPKTFVGILRKNARKRGES